MCIRDRSWSGYSNVQNTSQDLADNMTKEGAKEYSFSVRAVSNTPSKIFHSETVYADDPYKPGGASDKVSGTLDKITSGDIPMDQAPDALKENIKDVQVAMQSDPDVLAKVEALEPVSYTHLDVYKRQYEDLVVTDFARAAVKE